MYVFLTGSTGFVGRQVIDALLQHGHQVRALVRASGKPLPPEVETVIGDTTNYDMLAGAAHGCDAIINLVGIIREFPTKKITFQRLHTQTTQNLIRLAQETGIRRYIQMSANGTRADAVTGYHRSKWAAEQALHAADLDWTIFRPSLIFGPDDLFVNMLAGLIKTLPVVPVMGDGRYRLQPVHVIDVAHSFVLALERKDTIHQTYHCCGPEQLSYDQVLDHIGHALGRSRPVVKLHQPLGLMKPMVSVLQHFPLFPMTSDQLIMLLEENICRCSSWQETFSLELVNFDNGIRQYL
ncbi:MAG TPA: complex I NDUFA9 subunit family protein [Pelovirga sp.]|nr:complex I NDUFA9 subunit family protein [Pelovirga sp.]